MKIIQYIFYMIFTALILPVLPIRNALAEEVSEIPATLRLSDLIQSAANRNPDILATKAEWLASKTKVWQETALPDPMAEIAPGTDESEYMISQAIPFPVKLYERGKIAQNEAEVASLKHSIVKRDLLLRLTEAYYDLYFVDASIETIGEVKELLKRFESIASARYSNLSGAQRDVAKAQAEFSMALEKLYELEQKRESVVAVINALLNRDPMLPLGKAALPDKPVLDYSLVELVNIAVERRQEIQAAEEEVAKAAHIKRLAKLSYIPDLDVGVRLTKPEEGDDSWMIPIRFNVPIWQNRIIPQIQEAKLLEEARQADLLQVKNKTFQEVKDSYHRYQAAIKITELYETAVVPQAKLALSADHAGYESGKTDFLNLLDSERVYFNAKLAQIQFYTEALKAYVDLLRCCGLSVLSPKKEGANANEQK